METELKSLRIDRSQRATSSSSWATRWILGGIFIFVLLGIARFGYSKLNAATEVDAVRVRSAEAGSGSAADVVLNATGYIVAHHKIEVAAKVIGRVLWIGVEKGDHVKQGQVLVRLEDDEYRAQVQQAKGSLSNLEAKLSELKNGSRPEEIDVTTANLEQANADLVNYKINLDRMKELVSAKVSPKQSLDDAQAKYDGQVARVSSLLKTDKLSRLGPRHEQIAAMAGQVEQARGSLAYAETQLSNTVIKAPVSGTILERAVEKGEFVTTSFVGDKGAKGYVVSLADLNDLEVELDIAQNDFAKLHAQQKATVTTDAFPDRKYDGIIFEISPEANRQKATVQVKVKVLNPDDYLRPEMNASVKFLNDAKPVEREISSAPRLVIPPSAVKNDAVFVVLGGKAVARPVKTGPTNAAGIVIERGLIGGEDVIVGPPATLKSGDRVHVKGA
ncbi:MAG: efflux transporter, family, subunit [Bryobacterales bacterium]|nr:efflux transporter, family, subunit [Bryobacterales bacterium]